MQDGHYPYVYVDRIFLSRNWGGELENVAILVAIAVNEDGYRKVLGAAEGMKEDKASWIGFFQWLRGRGLDGVKLVAKMFKTVHAQESKKATHEKAKAVVAELRAMKLKEAAKKVEDGI